MDNNCGFGVPSPICRSPGPHLGARPGGGAHWRVPVSRAGLSQKRRHGSPPLMGSPPVRGATGVECSVGLGWVVAEGGGPGDLILVAEASSWEV